MRFKILYFGESRRQNFLDELDLNGVKSEWFATRQKEKALAIAVRERPRLIIVDFDQNQGRPLEFVSLLMEEANSAKVFGLTNNCPMSLVVKAIKMGVDEVINLEEEPHKLQQRISSLIQQCQEKREGYGLYRARKQEFDFTKIVGQCQEMQRVFDKLSKIIARKWLTVLILGETGTGKELIARAVHYNSFEQYQPFVEINCNALPENLLESELFGHEKGAFTDARTMKSGLFELAQDGTLFLDEIGDISSKVQVKLLKALEEKKIRHLGGVKDIQVNTRIIAATNRDLQAAIREGQFRNDLYYRLNVVSILLPPLRERGEDVVFLARHFLRQYSKEYESSFNGFTPEAESLLHSYCWPGNIRELKHTIERIVLLGEGEKVTRANLADAIESETPLIMAEKKQTTNLQIDIPPEGISLDEGERFLIETVLKKMAWNKRKTCQILKISRPRLDRKIQKYRLTAPQQAKERITRNA